MKALEEMSNNTVQLYLYDLTKLNKWNGAFRFSALAINSNNVIPHTTIVVFDTEYYYGETGVATLLTPGEVGDPVEIVVLGTTAKTSGELKSWLKEKISSGEYAASAYKLLDNNCICFANAMSEFLCGKPIDEKYFDAQKRAKLLGIRAPGREDKFHEFQGSHFDVKSIGQSFKNFFSGESRKSVDEAKEVKPDGTLKGSEQFEL